MAGWIKIYQSIREHWIWEKPQYLKWWLDLLMLAEWKDRRKMFGSSICIIKRGQLATSNRFLRDRWQCKSDDEPMQTPSPKTVMKFLSMLERDGMIKRDNTTLPNRVTLITICNYENYQSISDDGGGNVDDAMGNALNDTENNTFETEYEEVIENKDNNSSPSKEEQEFSFAEELKQDNNEIFWEQSCMALHCDMETLRMLLTDFTSEVVANQKWHSSFVDFRQHFYSWCRYAVARIQREKTTQQNQDGRLSNNRQPRSVEQKQQRGAEYASHIAAKLGINPGGEELH